MAEKMLKTKYPVLMLHGDISYIDEIDFRRSRFSGRDGEGVNDICDIYKEIVNGLIDKGF